MKGFAKGPRARDDNANPEGKLALRRYFLDRWHGDTKPQVLDCCQATGKLWGALRQEYDVKYWGVDRVAKKGRLAIDSSRLLAQPAIPFDVIDIDTYGSPWQHWRNMLPNLVKPVTVFMTLGHVGAMTAVDSAVIQALGLSRMKQKIPQSIRWKLDLLALDACLSKSYHYGVRITDAKEVIPASKNARYFGLRLEPSSSHSPLTPRDKS